MTKFKNYVLIIKTRRMRFGDVSIGARVVGLFTTKCTNIIISYKLKNDSKILRKNMYSQHKTEKMASQGEKKLIKPWDYEGAKPWYCQWCKVTGTKVDMSPNHELLCYLNVDWMVCKGEKCQAECQANLLAWYLNEVKKPEPSLELPFYLPQIPLEEMIENKENVTIPRSDGSKTTGIFNQFSKPQSLPHHNFTKDDSKTVWAITCTIAVGDQWLRKTIVLSEFLELNKDLVKKYWKVPEKMNEVEKVCVDVFASTFPDFVKEPVSQSASSDTVLTPELINAYRKGLRCYDSAGHRVA